MAKKMLEKQEINTGKKGKVLKKYLYTIYVYFICRLLECALLNYISKINLIVNPNVLSYTGSARKNLALK